MVSLNKRFPNLNWILNIPCMRGAMRKREREHFTFMSVYCVRVISNRLALHHVSFYCLSYLHIKSTFTPSYPLSLSLSSTHHISCPFLSHVPIHHSLLRLTLWYSFFRGGNLERWRWVVCGAIYTRHRKHTLPVHTHIIDSYTHSYTIG